MTGGLSWIVLSPGVDRFLVDRPVFKTGVTGR